MSHFRSALIGMFLLAPTMVSGMVSDADWESPEALEIRCLPEEQMASYLKAAWNEMPVLWGNPDEENRLVVYASNRGSWTLIEYSGDGLACVDSSGS